jgi:hypothetical protein
MSTGDAVHIMLILLRKYSRSCTGGGGLKKLAFAGSII